MAQQLCRHKGCTCAARADGYCSAYCAGDTAGATTASHACACGHDACEAPSKFESKEAFAEMAPEGRFIEDTGRDW